MSQSKMAGMAALRGPSGRYQRTNGKVVTAKGYLSLERARIASQEKARRFVAILLGGATE